MREGDRIVQHVDRFTCEGAYGKHLSLDDHIILDCRTSKPQQQHWYVYYPHINSFFFFSNYPYPQIFQICITLCSAKITMRYPSWTTGCNVSITQRAFALLVRIVSPRSTAWFPQNSSTAPRVLSFVSSAAGNSLDYLSPI